MNNPEENRSDSPFAERERAFTEFQEKEKELSKRTEMLENMMLAFSQLLPNLRVQESSQYSPTAPQSPQSAYSNFVHNSTTANNSPINSYPKSYLRDALELVPKYDGHNIPVWQFARACKRAKDSVPLVDEGLFVRMLRNKLTHHAYLAVEDEIHPTVEKFLDCLKRTFGPGRNSNYYRGQLSMAYKRPNEHVLDYIGRIKDLKTAIIEGDQANLNRPLTEVELASIESFALEAFFEGLPREYRIELRAEGYNGFPDACSRVIMINRRLEREELRYKTVRTSRDDTAISNSIRIQQRNSSSAPTNIAKPTVEFERKICSYCKRIGHLVNECRKRQHHTNSQYLNNNNSNDIVDQNQNQTNNNSNNTRAKNTGNYPEVSVNGTPRNLKNSRPTHCLEGNPIPCTSSEATMAECQQ